MKSPRKFSYGDVYTALVNGFRSDPLLKQNLEDPQIDEQFAERIMLAVTEVNGCALCAYDHTQKALKKGISEEDISALLGGETSSIKPEEYHAILFAQHYAETKGRVDEEAYQAFTQRYTHKQVEVIIAVIQKMMVGNSIGLPLSAYQRRKKGEPDAGSSVISELSYPIVTALISPFAIIQGALGYRMGTPLLKFSK